MSDAMSRNDLAEALVQEYARTKDPEIRERIAHFYSDMVERIARKYAGLETHEDLVQVGYIGLLNALNLFDAEKGVRFNTYATHLVVGSIKHHLRDKAKMIREPAWLQEARHKVNRAASRMQQELGRVPSPEEIATDTDLPPDTIREVLATDELFKVASLSTAQSQDDEESDEVDLADECADVLSFEERAVLERAIGELRELEQKVLILFHFDSLNQTEIANKLGISCNYVSHILRQSLSKLRAILADDERRERLLHRQASSLNDDVIDEVTGAYTETYLISRLDEECSRAPFGCGQVGFIHIRFGGLDTFGRFYGGDAVKRFLADAADFLRGGVRRLDIVGRLGPTGFGIILPGTGEVIATIRANLGQRLASWLAKAPAELDVAVGEACYPFNGRNAKAIIAATALAPLGAEKAA